MNERRLLKHILRNGLQIVGQLVPESTNVTICFFVSTGPRNKIGRVPTGTAYALEHLLFKKETQ